MPMWDASAKLMPTLPRRRTGEMRVVKQTAAAEENSLDAAAEKVRIRSARRFHIQRTKRAHTHTRTLAHTHKDLKALLTLFPFLWHRL